MPYPARAEGLGKYASNIMSEHELTKCASNSHYWNRSTSNTPCGKIHPYLPRRRIWHKVVVKVGIRGGRVCAWVSAWFHALPVIGSPGPKARCKWVIVCPRFTEYNVNLCLSVLVIDRNDQVRMSCSNNPSTKNPSGKFASNPMQP